MRALEPSDRDKTWAQNLKKALLVLQENLKQGCYQLSPPVCSLLLRTSQQLCLWDCNAFTWSALWHPKFLLRDLLQLELTQTIIPVISGRRLQLLHVVVEGFSDGGIGGLAWVGFWLLFWLFFFILKMKETQANFFPFLMSLGFLLQIVHK